MRRSSLLILALVVLLVSCKTVPDVFVTPQTDEAIEEVAKDITEISTAAKTLSETVEDIKPGHVLTDEQVETIKTATKVIVKASAKATVDNANVVKFHEQDNKAASGIVVDLVKEKQTNATLWKWIVALVLIIAIGTFLIIILKK